MRRTPLLVLGTAVCTSAVWLLVLAVGGVPGRPAAEPARFVSPLGPEEPDARAGAFVETDRRGSDGPSSSPGPTRSPEEEAGTTSGEDGAGPATPDPGPGTRGTPDRLAAELAALDRLFPEGAAASDEVWGRLARLHELADHPEGALRCYVEAYRLDPERSWRRGIARVPLEHRLPALEELAADLPSDDEIRGDLGDALVESGRTGEGADAFARALEIDPDDHEWSSKLARHDPWRAAGTLEPLAAERPTDDELLGDLGDAYREAGRANDAWGAYERAFRADPADHEWTGRLVEIDPHRAVELLEGYLAEEPGQDEHWGDLGDAYRTVGREAEALDAYREAAVLDPEDDEWVRKVTELDPASAVDDLRRRTEVHPNDDEAWGNLGDGLRLAGRTEEALEAYRRALELDPDDREWNRKVPELEEELGE